MAWGRQFPGTGTDPLFAVVFYLALLLNFIPVILTSVPPEMAVIGVAHAIFGWRIWRIRAWAGRQRAEDLARYQQLLRQQTTT
jgi:threonine/homoserine/homoserine lactone efflux protein